MSQPFRRAVAIGLTLTIVAVITACTPPPVSPTMKGLEIHVDGEQPTMHPAELNETATDGLSDLEELGPFIVGTPMDIDIHGELPSDGATVSRTYAAPIPADAAATFAYWDEAVGAWTAVPTTLSDDRYRITAVVHHFSIWNDIIAGSGPAIEKMRDAAVKAGQDVAEWTGDAFSEASNALKWSLGNILSKRVELPECTGATPVWVLDLPVSFEVEDPVRFCAGRDDTNPDLLVVKARVNRGYGFPFLLAVSPTWSYNSTSENGLAAVLGSVGSLDSVMGDSVSQLLNRGLYVGPGEEISFGIAPSAMTVYSSEYLLELPTPSIAQFVLATISQQAVAWGLSKTEGLLAASLVIATCLSEFTAAHDIGSAAGATQKCLSKSGSQARDLVEDALRYSGATADYAAQRAGLLVARISLALALLPGAIATADYISELNFPRNARALKITLVEKQVETASDWIISSAGVGPARFDAPTAALSSLGHTALRCDGTSQPWFVDVWGDDSQVSTMFVVSGSTRDLPSDAPQTRAGVTLGTTEDELIALGYGKSDVYGPSGETMYSWLEDGREFAADLNESDRVYAIAIGSVYLPAGFCS